MNGRDGKRVNYKDTDSEVGPKLRSAEFLMKETQEEEAD